MQECKRKNKTITRLIADAITTERNDTCKKEDKHTHKEQTNEGTYAHDNVQHVSLTEQEERTHISVHCKVCVTESWHDAIPNCFILVLANQNMKVS